MGMAKMFFLSGLLLTANLAHAGSGDLIVDGTLKLQDSSPINASKVDGGANFEYPYRYELTVDGDPNTFYPVAMSHASNGGVPGRFVISRVYTDSGPTGLAGQPSAAHVGGLMAVFSTMNTCWSDYCYVTLEKYRYTYVRTIADITNLPAASDGRTVVVRLRGGGFRYRFYANYNLNPLKVTPGTVAYSISPYTFNYPNTIALGSLPSNAFANNTSIPTDL